MTKSVSMMTESDLTSPTSTTPSSDTSRKMEDKVSYRKSNKPMMEKKRRARINSCLTQLKSLVLQAMKKDNSQYSKLEKADILELTVKHLKNVQRLHSSLSTTSVPDAMNKYRAGFNECANEVMRYLGETHDVNSDARTRILSHLATILTPINSLPLQQSHTPILPAPVASSAVSSTSTSSNVILQQQQHQQQQQSHIAHHALQVSHHQERQLHQNQQHSLLPRTDEAMTLGKEHMGPNNISLNVPAAIAAQACHVQGHGIAAQSNLNHVISASPTAFHPPANPVATSSTSGLQIPCIATAPTAIGSTTSLQFVPNTLPTGQVAFVLTPQSIPSMNLYTPSVIASSATISPEFAMSVIDQQQRQQQQQQHQQERHSIKQQQEKRQMSIPANNLTLKEGPIALVSKPISTTGSTNHPPSLTLERSRSSAPPSTTEPLSSLSKSTPMSPHTLPTLLSRPQEVMTQSSSFSRNPYADSSVSKTEITDSCNMQDNIDNTKKEDGYKTPTIHNLDDRLRISNSESPRRGISDHYTRGNIENVRRELPVEFVTRDRFRKHNNNNKTFENRWDIELKEEPMEVAMTKRTECDIMENEIIDFRTTTCRSDVKTKANQQSTWRPW